VSIWLVDIMCALLVVLGIALALKRPAHQRGGPHANDQPQTYILRISGVMVATFGLALGLMATVFHFA
jgi:hypothetical protein